MATGPDGWTSSDSGKPSLLRRLFVQPSSALIALIAILLCLCYAYVMIATSPALDEEIDYQNLLSETLLCLFAAGSLMIWSQFEGSNRTRWTMFLGLLLFLTGFTTDALDEVVPIPTRFGDWMEGFTLNIAFAIISYGVWSWTREWKATLAETRRFATTDSLTGAMNRRHFMAVFDHMSAIAARQASKLTVLLFDLDNFKSINDTQGHAEGDQVLRQVAAVTRLTLRRSDLFCRYGGEEFAILLPDTDLEGGRQVAEKLRLAIADARLTNAGKISASFGVAQLRPDESADHAINRADKALYAAKGAGRNTVVTAGD